MPLYETRCSICPKQETRKLSFQDFERVASGEMGLLCLCGEKSELVFDPSGVSFVLKDCVSGGWATKAAVENKYRAARARTMDRKTRDHVKPNKLIPNHNGAVANSWAEAKDAAYQSTYERVNREHGARTAASAATEAAKTYDTHVKREGT